jgi:tripartite-type tricarboxylate transporter receptor subunit TctC
MRRIKTRFIAPCHDEAVVMRYLFDCAAIAITLTASSTSTLAQTYPVKPLRIIAAQSAGGVTDMLARTLAQKFNESWKQPAVVENRPGAGGAIGTEVAAKSAPDGYTLLLSSAGPIVINQYLYPSLAYDPLRDLQPIAFIASSPLILVTHPSVPARSVRELIALARAKPDKLSYGSGGSGSPPHLTAELFKTTTGVRMVHVPYKGSAPSVLALVAGQVDLSFSTVVITLPQIKAGRLHALAVTSPKRSRVVPDLPTMEEAGVAGFESQQWFGLFAPAGLAQDIVSKIYAETTRVIQSPQIRDRLANEGGEPDTLTPDQFAAFIRRDAARWAKVVKDSGATAD